MALPLDSFCRLCAHEKLPLTSLLKNPVTVKKIERLFPVQLFDIPELPKKICKLCCRRVEESFTMYVAVCAADRKLRSNLVGMKEAEEPCHSTGGEPVAGVAQDDVNASSDTQPIAGQNKLSDLDKKSTEFVCPHCFTFLDSKVSLRNHVKTDHPNEAITRKYQCRVCIDEFLTKESRSLHEPVHADETPYLCDHCGKMFTHSNNLIKHLSTHSSVRRKFVCDMCPKSFLTRTFLKEHQNIHNGVAPFGCEICGKTFHGRTHLRQHRWTHAGRTFGCSFCNQAFKRKANMTAHVKEFHLKAEGEKKMSAGKERPAPAEGDSEIHQIKSAKIVKSTYDRLGLTCMKCRLTFGSVEERKEHNSTHHIDFAQCNMCGKQFKHSGSLTYHRRVAHTGDRPYQCRSCDQKFLIQSALTVHERKVHTGERPYICSSCGSSFLRAGDLRKHNTTHTGVRNFACEVCGNFFRTKGSLTVHLKGHQGLKEYKCSHCSKEFIEKNDMLKHEKTHNLPFFCKFCGESFARKTESAKHALCRKKALYGPDMSDLGAAEKILDLVAQDQLPA